MRSHTHTQESTTGLTRRAILDFGIGGLYAIDLSCPHLPEELGFTDQIDEVWVFTKDR
jgi:hypothetical protein